MIVKQTMKLLSSQDQKVTIVVEKTFEGST